MYNSKVILIFWETHYIASLRGKAYYNLYKFYIIFMKN